MYGRHFTGVECVSMSNIDRADWILGHLYVNNLPAGEPILLFNLQSLPQGKIGLWHPENNLDLLRSVSRELLKSGHSLEIQSHRDQNIWLPAGCSIEELDTIL